MVSLFPIPIIPLCNIGLIIVLPTKANTSNEMYSSGNSGYELLGITKYTPQFNVLTYENVLKYELITINIYISAF